MACEKHKADYDPGMSEQRILVTGATGFIGGRLADRLAREQQTIVTGTGRNVQAAASLPEAGVLFQPAELLDFSAMRALVEGQDIVYHVAAWLGSRHGSKDMAWALNVYATIQLLHMAAAAGVRRFVYVSSIAAFGPTRLDTVTEETPVDVRQGAVYGRTKAEAELHAQQLARELGIELVIVRPGMVYGPGSYSWTVRMTELVQKRLPVIFGTGDGHAYPVYIDNLIDALVLAGKCPEAAGADFNVVDRAVTWREWFTAHGRIAGRRPVAVPLWAGRAALRAVEWLPLGLGVDRNLIGYYTAKTVFPTTKARRLLGYEPRIDFAEGMARAGAWMREAGLLS
jgi:nucleoside-diphosphate-sugar epimerase